MWAFPAYGLEVCVNRPIHGLTVPEHGKRKDVQVWLDGVLPWPGERLDIEQRVLYVSAYCDQHGKPALRVWEMGGGAYFRLAYLDGTEFLIDGSGTRVWAAWRDGATLEDTVSYLLGPVMGFVLRLRGITCLHASAVCVDGWAIALLGPPEAGKSTTAAAFAGLGYPALCDDIVALTAQEGIFLAQPGYPRLRLWPTSIDALLKAESFPPNLVPTSRDRRYHLDLTQNGYRFQSQPLPLGSIYMLGERCSKAGVPYVEPLPGQSGLMNLVGNTYGSSLLDEKMRAKEFRQLGELMARVPLRRVYSHEDPAYLLRLCEVILDDLLALESCTPIAPEVKLPS